MVRPATQAARCLVTCFLLTLPGLTLESKRLAHKRLKELGRCHAEYDPKDFTNESCRLPRCGGRLGIRGHRLAHQGKLERLQDL